jgi:hypothetical protein
MPKKDNLKEPICFYLASILDQPKHEYSRGLGGVSTTIPIPKPTPGGDVKIGVLMVWSTTIAPIFASPTGVSLGICVVVENPPYPLEYSCLG